MASVSGWQLDRVSPATEPPAGDTRSRCQPETEAIARASAVKIHRREQGGGQPEEQIATAVSRSAMTRAARGVQPSHDATTLDLRRSAQY